MGLFDGYNPLASLTYTITGRADDVGRRCAVCVHRRYGATFAKTGDVCLMRNEWTSPYGTCDAFKAAPPDIIDAQRPRLVRLGLCAKEERQMRQAAPELEYLGSVTFATPLYFPYPKERTS